MGQYEASALGRTMGSRQASLLRTTGIVCLVIAVAMFGWAYYAYTELDDWGMQVAMGVFALVGGLVMIFYMALRFKKMAEARTSGIIIDIGPDSITYQGLTIGANVITALHQADLGYVGEHSKARHGHVFYLFFDGAATGVEAHRQHAASYDIRVGTQDRAVAYIEPTLIANEKQLVAELIDFAQRHSIEHTDHGDDVDATEEAHRRHVGV